MKSTRGVTLIELLLVVAIIAIVGATTIPVGSGFYRRSGFRDVVSEVAASLRTAQINAVSGKAGDSWGVRVIASEIIIFKGSSYATRDTAFDQKYKIPGSVNVTDSEVVYSYPSGNPGQTTVITVTSANQSNTLEVNEVGVVNVN